MHPRIFMRAMEEQLRKVMTQYSGMKQDGRRYEIEHDELLNNAKTWFLRTLENTELNYDDITIPAIEFLEDESLAKERAPPYGYVYPSIIWMISILEKEQIESIFSASYYMRLMQASTLLKTRVNNHAYMLIYRRCK